MEELEFNHPYLFDYQDYQNDKEKKIITLWTYSDEGQQFTVDRAWLNKIISEFGYDNEEEFLTDYTFDLSYEILKIAEQEKTLI